MWRRLVFMLVAVQTWCFVKMPLYAEIPAADAYIFPITCGNQNTDIDQNAQGHWEYFHQPLSTTLPRYTSQGCDFAPNQNIGRVAYGFGQNDAPEIFISNINNGLGAGNHTAHYNKWGDAGVESWATGVDCSGFVCNIWGEPHTATGYWTTIAYRVPRWDAQTLDSLLGPGHVRLYESGNLEVGDPIVTFYEAYYGQPEYGVRRVSGFSLEAGYELYRHGQDVAPPVISDVSASPNPFAPDGDGVNDTSGLTFSVSDTQTGAVSIELLINNQLVHTFPYTCLDGVKLPKIEGGYKKENLTWAWDGRINGDDLPPSTGPLLGC